MFHLSLHTRILEGGRVSTILEPIRMLVLHHLLILAKIIRPATTHSFLNLIHRIIISHIPMIQQPPFAQNYSPEISNPSSYPNFQSYPSFQESSFPCTPTHQPSYYHGADLPYSQESTATPSISNYQSTAQYSNPNSTGNQAGSSISPADSYKYDSNYQPPVEKIADAHKAARFAVGALAFRYLL
ncbi:hypothetical protein KFK09_016654 [Dendrobium nobile]|uniref:Uncharacterized protein n=1 Tax=Dendrobium nobile TaxID=94219 RepID=A0A8T3AZ96_DENNO|nr:hypothetical protein KFK09_016654 [Dendrobium nobile]